jgi:hypothetical protein
LIALLALLACGDDEGEETTIDVTLQEFSITLSQSSAPSGDVTFEIDNEGPDLDHELRVIRTDFAPDELPTNDDGTADLGAAGVNDVGHTAKVEADRRGGGVFNLDAGAYVLLCNFKDEVDGEDVAHYSAGMRVAFTVEESASSD